MSQPVPSPREWFAARLDPAAGSCFALIDSSRHPLFSDVLKQHGIRARCLFTGIAEVRLGRYAPYCAEFPLDGALAAFWFNHQGQGWREQWGWLFQSQADLDTLRGHFKKFVQVELSDGSSAYWRFYDPRVFCKVVPLMTQAQHTQMFGSLINRAYCFHDPQRALLELGWKSSWLDTLSGVRSLELKTHILPDFP